ncbi:MAG TPA: Do family serine endopeptidase [Aliidongia sp.]|nr:Do family serine endopeptidase [Aliidongia sp.]
MAGALLAAMPASEAAGTDILKKLVDVSVPLPSLSPLVRRVMPAVVNVSAEVAPDPAEESQAAAAQTPFDEFLRRYFEQRGLPAPAPAAPQPPQPGQKIFSLGSGFIIDPSGFIVTNNHVVARATKITVILPDNSRHPATLVGADAKTDLALLKIAAKSNLPVLQWGDSDKVQVGDWVMAVGNPFGLGGSVTAGIVSALGRDIQQGPFDDFLQIDAPINRGNSGGPTFETNGKVVGINTAIYSPTGGSVGIGFAIPSNIARDVVKQLRDKGHADHGYLGLTVQVISPDVAHALKLDPDNPPGLLVDDLDAGGPAAKAGLLQGDVIKQANGHPVQAAHDISRLVALARIGDKLNLIANRDGKDVSLRATIGQAPTDEQAEAQQKQSAAPAETAPMALGIRFAELTPDLRTVLHVSPTLQGAIIDGIDAGSPAAAIGLAPGDVLVSINRQPVDGPYNAAEKLAEASKDDVLLFVNRHGLSQFTALPAVDNPDTPQQ